MRRLVSMDYLGKNLEVWISQINLKAFAIMGREATPNEISKGIVQILENDGALDVDYKNVFSHAIM